MFVLFFDFFISHHRHHRHRQPQRQQCSRHQKVQQSHIDQSHRSIHPFYWPTDKHTQYKAAMSPHRRFVWFSFDFVSLSFSLHNYSIRCNCFAIFFSLVIRFFFQFNFSFQLNILLLMRHKRFFLTLFLVRSVCFSFFSVSLYLIWFFLCKDI